jgi:hypothetical protein
VFRHGDGFPSYDSAHNAGILILITNDNIRSHKKFKIIADADEPFPTSALVCFGLLMEIEDAARGRALPVV